MTASEALTSLLSSLPPLPVASGDSSLLSARRVSIPPSACKVEEISDDELTEATGSNTQRHGSGHDRQSSSSSSKCGRPHSAGEFSQASQSTASTSLSLVSETSPTPPNLPARNDPITLQLATALQSPAPPPPQPAAAATSLTVVLDPHLLHLLYLYSNRSLSPFSDQSIWSCFLSHLQQPDPNHPGHLVALCDKQYQRSSRRSFKNHVWKCLCRHFPAIAKFTYPEFRRLCATDRTVMSGFHAVTLFPRPQKKRRSTAELNDGERWLCPHGCGQEYRNTSSTSIGRHMRKECRLKDKNEEEKEVERRTLKQHEKEAAAYRALKAASDPADDADMASSSPARDASGGMAGEVEAAIHRKRVRLSSTEPISASSTVPILPTAAVLSASASAMLLPGVQAFSSAVSSSSDGHQMPLIAARAVPSVGVNVWTAGGATHQHEERAVEGTGGGSALRVMSTAEIAQLEAQLMETMHTQIIVDRLLADRLLVDMTARAAAAMSENNTVVLGEALVARDSGGAAAVADGTNQWRRSSGGAINTTSASQRGIGSVVGSHGC